MASVSRLSRFSHQPVLLVGSGFAARNVLLRLLNVGARVHWFAQDADVAEEIWLVSRPGCIAIALRDPQLADIAQAAAVIVAVGEPLAGRVAAQARLLDRPVAVLDRPDLSTFDLDDTDDGGPGDAASHLRLGSTLRRASAWLSAHLSRAMAVLVALPPSFGT